MPLFSILKYALYVTVLLLMTAAILNHVWKRRSVVRTIFARGCLLTFTLLYLGLCLEFATSKWLIRSEGMGLTLAAERWKNKYWHPINSLGYRDVEHDSESFEGRRALFVVGDSFMAGYGIDDPEDRLANTLARELGEDWKIVLIARCGWDTTDEYEAVLAYPHRPDAILLSYFVNDIRGARVAVGLVKDKFTYVSKPHWRIRPYVEKSSLCNFAYWELYRSNLWPKTLEYDYGEDLRSCYESEAIWRHHEQELLAIISYAGMKDIMLSVIVWPHLMHIEESKALTSRVVRLFQEQGVPVLDLVPHFEKRNLRRLVVNTLDAHPNEAVHAEVARLVLQKLPLPPQQQQGVAMGN